MGGRGYTQWRGPGALPLSAVNNSDAYLMIWDHKLYLPRGLM